MTKHTSAILLIFLKESFAHLPLGFEPERIRQDDSSTEESFAFSNRTFEDFSFEQPYDIFANLYEGLLAGPPLFEEAARLPMTAHVIQCSLKGNDDVDYFMYDMANPNLEKYTPSAEDHPKDVYDFVAYPLLPECRNYDDFFPSIAMIGPINTTNVDGDFVFSPPSGDEPFHVPEGFGVIIKPGTKGEHTSYKEEDYTYNHWILPVEYPEDCIEDYSNEDCMKSPGVITLQGIPYDSTSGPFYFAVYDEATWESSVSFKDVDVIFGHTDKFLASDFIRLGGIAQFISRGRTIGDKCLTASDLNDDTKESMSEAWSGKKISWGGTALLIFVSALQFILI